MDVTSGEPKAGTGVRKVKKNTVLLKEIIVGGNGGNETVLSIYACYFAMQHCLFRIWASDLAFNLNCRIAGRGGGVVVKSKTVNVYHVIDGTGN